MKEFQKRKPNQYDIPALKKVRLPRASILNPSGASKFGQGLTLNLETIQASGKSGNSQPMTSLMPKKNKQLDAMKLDLNQNSKKTNIKDDFDSARNAGMKQIQEENDNESQDSMYRSRLQAVAIGQPKSNPLLARRQTIRNTLQPPGMPAFGSAPTLRPNQSADDQSFKEQEERRIKKTAAYEKLSKKFINICDSQGKSPLHYATLKGNVQLIKLLLKNGAIPVMRDHKSRVRPAFYFSETH